MRNEPRRPAAGFSLLEIMVAFTLMALFVAVLMRVFSGGLLGVGLAGDLARATSIAESMLARVGADIEIKEGSTSGEAARRFRWTVAIAPEPVAPAPDAPAQPMMLRPIMLMRVDVTVLWDDAGRERKVALSTLRLGPRV